MHGGMGSCGYFEHCFQKHTPHTIVSWAYAHFWSNRQELQSKEQATGQWVSLDLNCSVAPPGHVPSLGLGVSNWDSKVRLEGLWDLFQLLLSFTPSLLLTCFLSLSLVLFCYLTLTLLLVLSFALSAKHPRAYHKCVTGPVINIPHSIQPEVCSFFRGLPWGGTGLFQKAESWPVPGYLCTCGLEPVDRRKLTSYPTRMLLWTKKHWWQVDGLGFRLAWARQVQKQVQKQGTKFSSLNFSKTFVRGKNRIIFWAGHQESEPTCKDASSVGNLGPGLQSSVPTSNEFPLHYAYHSVRTPVMLGEKELNFYFC